MARYYRKVLHIGAMDSPNVRVAIAESGAEATFDADGEITGFTFRKGPPSNRIRVPGVLSWSRFIQRLTTWDPLRRTIGLWGHFYTGAEVRLYPLKWLIRAEQKALWLAERGVVRKAKAIGIDPGEGAANTAWAVTDDYGLIDLLSYPTPDTSVIPPQTIALGRKYGVDPSFWIFDRGGGGYEHVCTLRALGFKGVRSVGFGEAVSVEPKRGMTQFEEKLEVREEKYAYTNRRAQMYGLLRERLDPAYGSLHRVTIRPDGTSRPEGSSASSRIVDFDGFAIPGASCGAAYALLREELEPIPLRYDREGRLYLLPKNKRTPDSDEETLTQLIGHSPDEADALVLALYGMTYTQRQATAGSF